MKDYAKLKYFVSFLYFYLNRFIILHLFIIFCWIFYGIFNTLFIIIFNSLDLLLFLFFNWYHLNLILNFFKSLTSIYALSRIYDITIMRSINYLSLHITGNDFLRNLVFRFFRSPNSFSIFWISRNLYFLVFPDSTKF